ncbi:MAG TPA: lysozyme [Burkholderiaceae bacterium]|nr:lysozyme [Burkholderiaceae bacterium]
MAPPAVDQVQAAELTARLCRRVEGFRARPYLCPAGVPTIGYGATASLDGRAVRLDDPPLSREAADRLLQGQILRVYLPGTQALCPGLEGRALAAVTDFAFNLGLARLKGSTLRRRLLASDMAGAAAELRKWIRAGGRVLPGLVLRREAEAALVQQRPTRVLPDPSTRA